MYQSGANQYHSVNATSEVLDADPHRLIQLLMEAALTRMAQAKGAIARSDMEEKARLLGRVSEIIQTMQSSLNHNQGGEIAQNLDRLYDYMLRRLIEGTRHNNVEMIDEVMGLMLEVKSGWDGIRQEYLQASQPVNNSDSEQTAGSLAGSLASHLSI